MINLKKKGRRIEVRSNEPLPGLRTAIPGAYYSTGGYWTVPLSFESYTLLCQKYGKERVRSDMELRRWVRGVVDSRKYMSELAASSDADLEHVAAAAPKLARAMRKRTYQRVGTRFIADNSATLVADEPGLGKTMEAMAGILEAQVPGPYLVIAPKTAADSVWRREINRWLPINYRAVILPQHRDQREYRIRVTRYTEDTWLIVHPEIVLVQAYWVCHECGKHTVEGNSQQRTLACGHIRDRKTKKLIQPSYPKLFEVEWGAIIADESHEILIRRKGVPTQRRRGMDLLKLRGDGIKLAMSGTPFDSKPHQLWGTLNWLDPVTYSAFHRWAELYWQKAGYTGFEIGEFRKDREQMLWDSLSSVALRRTKLEVAKDLPAKMYIGSSLVPSEKDSPVGVWLEMEDKQERAYREMEETSIAELESGRVEAITALAELTRLKQLACAYGDIKSEHRKVNCYAQQKKKPVRHWKPCRSCRRDGFHMELRYLYKPHLPSNKFNWIVENLEEWGYPKNPLTKVVIVSFYTGILEMMAAGIEKHFKRKPGNELVTAITGRVPSGSRRRILDRFNCVSDRTSPQIMMLNVKAGGTAITIDSADRMIFISETRNPAQQSQAEDRIHRVSNPRQCMYYYLRSLGTVDIGTALMNQEMARASHQLLDARRGVDYVRQVMDLSRVA